MKYVYKIMTGLALFAGLASSCKDDDASIPGGIAVDKEEVTVGPEGGTERITVNSYKNWVAGASRPWIARKRFGYGGMPACHRLYLREHGTHLANTLCTGRPGIQTDNRYPVRFRETNHR